MSTAQSRATNAHPCGCTFAITAVKSSIERESRSSLATMSASAPPPLELLERRPGAWGPQVLRAGAGVLEHLDDLPAAPPALGPDRRALRLESGAAVGLLFRVHAYVGHHSHEAPPYHHPGGATGENLLLTPKTANEFEGPEIPGHRSQRHAR
jgi:hypothetical protein